MKYFERKVSLWLQRYLERRATDRAIDNLNPLNRSWDLRVVFSDLDSEF